MRLPNRALTNIDILEYANGRIPFFRGVYMRDTLPKKSHQVECAIVNLDSSINDGTHWVAYVKFFDYCEYFDSFGNLKPPLELVKYLKYNIQYNYSIYQNYNTFNCGHLCLKYLINFWKNSDVIINKYLNNINND